MLLKFRYWAAIRLVGDIHSNKQYIHANRVLITH
jgi:hypothetical protein